MKQTDIVELYLSDPEETAALGRRLSPALCAGDCVLLEGGIGSGKTHLARALIQEWLRSGDLWEDVPSPTFTLVQTYSNGDDELWHADLYRLTSLSEVEELGLFEAFESKIVLVEWPDRLGAAVPHDALKLSFKDHRNGRRMAAQGPERLLSALTVAA